MKGESARTEVNQVLKGLGEVWVYLSEYRLTHGGSTEHAGDLHSAQRRPPGFEPLYGSRWRPVGPGPVPPPLTKLHKLGKG